MLTVAENCGNILNMDSDYISKFVTVSKGMCGYYICLADDAGIVTRLEDWNYNTFDECAIEAEKLANAYNIKYLNYG